jgi:hypothetical protein
MWLSEVSVGKESVAEGAGWARSVAEARASLAGQESMVKIDEPQETLQLFDVAGN